MDSPSVNQVQHPPTGSAIHQEQEAGEDHERHGEGIVKRTLGDLIIAHLE